MISVSTMATYWLPPATSAERPWALLAVRMGSHLSKIIGPALTPFACSRFGWRQTCRLYAGFFLAYSGVWTLLAQERPAGYASAAEKSTARPEGEATAADPAFTLRLLVVKPMLSILFSQVAHDLLEFQTYASYAPVYFSEALGVPLGRVGFFTLPPMVAGMVGKFLVTVYESALLSRGVDRLMIRKLSNTMASGKILQRGPHPAAVWLFGTNLVLSFPYRRTVWQPQLCRW